MNGLQEKFPNTSHLQDIGDLPATGTGLSESEAELEGEHVTELPRAVAIVAEHQAAHRDPISAHWDPGEWQFLHKRLEEHQAPLSQGRENAA